MPVAVAAERPSESSGLLMIELNPPLFFNETEPANTRVPSLHDGVLAETPPMTVSSWFVQPDAALSSPKSISDVDASATVVLGASPYEAAVGGVTDRADVATVVAPPATAVDGAAVDGAAVDGADADGASVDGAVDGDVDGPLLTLVAHAPQTDVTMTTIAAIASRCATPRW